MTGTGLAIRCVTVRCSVFTRLCSAALAVALVPFAGPGPAAAESMDVVQQQGAEPEAGLHLALSFRLTARELSLEAPAGLRVELTPSPGVNALRDLCQLDAGVLYRGLTVRLEVTDEAATLTCEPSPSGGSASELGEAAPAVEAAGSAGSVGVQAGASEAGASEAGASEAGASEAGASEAEGAGIGADTLETARSDNATE